VNVLIGIAMPRWFEPGQPSGIDVEVIATGSARAAERFHRRPLPRVLGS